MAYSTSSDYNSADNVVIENNDRKQIDLSADISTFVEKFAAKWNMINNSLLSDDLEIKNNAHKYIDFLLGDKLREHINIELTVGEINRIHFDQYADSTLPNEKMIFSSIKNHIEIYISPNRLDTNVKYMNSVYNKLNSLIKKNADKFANLKILKYKAYHPKDSIIEDITYEDYTVSYLDIGCQVYLGYKEQNESNKLNQILNLVILIKKNIADKVLKKETLKVVNEEGKVTSVEKWLPSKSNCVDILLLNIIGEYNLINKIGYIEFLPEDDPLVAEGSIFTELTDIKKYITLVENNNNCLICHNCQRRSLQCEIHQCSRCKVTQYCGKLCQIIDYKFHKATCKRSLI